MMAVRWIANVLCLVALIAGWVWITVEASPRFEFFLGVALLWIVGNSFLGEKEQARRAREAEQPGWGRYV
jgi:hypothetical protein